MGGMGSGRSGFRRIAEHTNRIDIREWRRRGYLRFSTSFTWRWHVDGEPAGSIGVTTAPPGAILLFYTLHTERPVPIQERITLTSSPCHFGGRREYFLCQRCSRRAEILYLASGYFRCRKCARVGYAIENLEKQWR